MCNREVARRGLTVFDVYEVLYRVLGLKKSPFSCEFAVMGRVQGQDRG